jgi:hypothetical protein
MLPFRPSLYGEYVDRARLYLKTLAVGLPSCPLPIPHSPDAQTDDAQKP